MKLTINNWATGKIADAGKNLRLNYTYGLVGVYESLFQWMANSTGQNRWKNFAKGAGIDVAEKTWNMWTNNDQQKLTADLNDASTTYRRRRLQSVIDTQTRGVTIDASGVNLMSKYGTNTGLTVTDDGYGPFSGQGELNGNLLKVCVGVITTLFAFLM